jgi:hypothetical protein
MAFRFSISLLAIVALTACGRSGLDEEQVEQLATATNDSATALQQSNDNATAIEELDGRVDTLEEGGGDTPVQDQIDAVAADVTDTQEDLQDLDARVDMIEGMFPVVDDAVVVDDREAAGFPSAAPVDNAEQGFNYLNQRIDVTESNIDQLGNDVDAVAGAVTSLEVSFGSDLISTVTNVVNQEVTSGNITVQADYSFSPAPDVNPMDNTFDVVEYSDAGTYEQAIRALRYANQSKYVPKGSDTRLGGLTRNYVQEAIDALDTDVYDVIYGNIAIDLNATSTIDGDTIDVYVSDLVENDVTLLTNIFNTTYFQDAVTNVITGGAGPGVTAADVTVDPTNLGAPADYATVQVSLESLYTRLTSVEADVAQNTTDIATNAADIATNTAATATNATNIAANATNIATNATDIANNTADNATNATNIANNTTTIATNTTNITTNATDITTIEGDITAIQTDITTITNNVANQTAAQVAFDNTAHAPFDVTNNTTNVQIAIEDLHEQATRLSDSLDAIAAGGGLCEDGLTACTADANCAGIGAGTCVFAVTNADNVVYDNATYPTVDVALDYLFTQLVLATAMVGAGNYYNDGDDVRVAVEVIDQVLYDLGLDVAANQVAITDLDNRLTTIELQVAAHTADIATNAADIAANVTAIANNVAAIAANTTGIATNAGEIANNAADIAQLQADYAADIAAVQADIAASAADIAGNTADIAGNTADIAANTADIAANTADIADLDTRVANLEDFNNNQLETTIQNLIDASIQDLVDNTITDLDNRLTDVENNQANFAGTSFILGLSAQQSTGRFQFGGETGVRAATAMCQTTFPDEANAHLCTVPEVQEAISLGNYANGNFTGQFTWTQTGLSRRHNSIDAFTNADSRRTSCLDFLYNSGDVASGTRLRVLLNEPSFGNGGVGIAGDMIDIRPNFGCSNTLPVLCCR